MKNVLLFGGAGFLGHYLVEELCRRGFKVTVADLKEGDVTHEKCTYVKCDISSKNEIKSVFSRENFAFVYNLAGFANLDEAIKSPIKTIELNVLSNMYIIENCIESGIERYIYASSAYAMSNKGSFYGISKLASEKIIEEYHSRYNLPFTILRYGSVYSQRYYDNNYIYNLVKSAIKNNEIIHKGDGQEIREYIHAADAAKLSVDIIESKEYENYHIILTGNERMKRLDLFNMINEILNGKLKIECTSSDYTNHYKFTPYSFEPSVSKKLIANPHIDMGQGILECIREVHKEL